jgi:hypothetical protein
VKRALGPLALAAAGVLLCLLLWYWPHVRNETFVILGNRDEAGGWYGWWSGNAGGLQIFEWIALGVLLYRHHNCEVRGCWRVKRHTTAGGHAVCRRHSPDGAPTREDVITAHEAAKREMGCS